MNILKKKEKDKIENWEEKLQSIKNVLEMADNPLSYEEIERETKLSHDEVFRIIGWYFSKITKETTSMGFVHPDFYLFGDNVKHINKNFGYKILKSRLEVGAVTARHTRGHLR